MPEPAGRDVLDTPQAGPAAMRGGLIRTVGYVVAVALSAASAPLLVRHLGVDDFGRYVAVISLITVAGGLTDAGLTAIGVREYSTRAAGEREVLLRNLLGIRLVLSGVGVLGAVAFALLADYEGALVIGTALAGLGMLLQVAQATLLVPLAAGLQLGWVTAVDLLRQVVLVIGIVALVVAGAELLPFLTLTLLAAIAGMVMTAVLVRRTISLRPGHDRHIWMELLRETAPFAAATALGVAYFRMTVLLMSLIATARETGLFATSFRILEVLIGIPALMIGAMFPVLARAARDDHERLSYALDRVFHGALVLGAFLAVTLIVGAPLAIEIIGGDEARGAVPVLRIQGAAILATFLAATFQFGLLSLKRYRVLLLANATGLVAAVGLTLALEPELGARGAAVAAVAAEFLLAAVSLVGLLRAGAGVTFGVRPVAVVAVASAVALAAVALPGGDIVRTAAAIALYGAVLLAGRGLPPEVVEGLRRRAATSP